MAIKQLGTNGGGFFNANSAHPFENPTPFSNFFELLAILLIPAGLTYTFGKMVGNTRQGWTVFAVMIVVLVGMVAAVYAFEARGVPQEAAAGANIQAVTPARRPARRQHGGQGEPLRHRRVGHLGRRHRRHVQRLGQLDARLLHPAGRHGPAHPHRSLGEVIFGGVGSGLYGILVFAIIAVFIAGLMVGRTPEYLGKKIEMYEMKMAALIILIPVVLILFGTAVAVSTGGRQGRHSNPGPHGLTRDPLRLLFGRRQQRQRLRGPRRQHRSSTTSPWRTGHAHRPLLDHPPHAGHRRLAGQEEAHPRERRDACGRTARFLSGLLIAVIIVVGALSFFPALALGPVVEHLCDGALMDTKQLSKQTPFL